MGASKTHQYSFSEIKSAKIANALAHPARIRIINIVQSEIVVRNVDLIKELKLVKSTVHDHIMKLKDAELVELEYHANSYLVKPNRANINEIPFHFGSL